MSRVAWVPKCERTGVDRFPIENARFCNECKGLRGDPMDADIISKIQRHGGYQG
jgi:hypothetical protein